MPKEKTFSTLAREVFNEKLPAAQWTRAEWTGKSNIVWATVQLEQNHFGYFIIQRAYKVEITGELAFSEGKCDPGLFFSAVPIPNKHGARQRIGHLLGKGDIWWPCSQEIEDMKEDIEVVIDLLIKQAPSFFEQCTKRLNELKQSGE